MPATGSRCASRRLSAVDRLAVVSVLGIAGLVIAFVPLDQARAKPGDVVSYREDKVGRPWRIIREYEHGRFLIRNGRVRAIADAEEIQPYTGVSPDVTIQMAGTCWKDKVLEIRRRQDRTVAASGAVSTAVPAPW